MQLGNDSKKTRAPSSSAVERRRCTVSRTSPYRSVEMPAHGPPLPSVDGNPNLNAPVTPARLKPQARRKAARRSSVSVGWKNSDAFPVLLHIGQSLLHCSPKRKRAALAGVTGSSSGTVFLKSRGASGREKSLPGAVILKYDLPGDPGHAHQRRRSS